MNHCLLEVKVKKAPTIRYTQDNKTPIAEMEVLFEGLRSDDPPGEIKVVGWGNIAQDMQNRIQTGQTILIEGRLRMNTLPRQDGTKEKRAELTLSKLHLLSEKPATAVSNGEIASHDESSSASEQLKSTSGQKNINSEESGISWNTAPLVPDTDDIPF